MTASFGSDSQAESAVGWSTLVYRDYMFASAWSCLSRPDLSKDFYSKISVMVIKSYTFRLHCLDDLQPLSGHPFHGLPDTKIAQDLFCASQNGIKLVPAVEILNGPAHA